MILALPDGAAAPFIEALEQKAPHRIVIDLSADHRFDDAWAYGLPELNRAKIVNAKRIANPGCYATAMQLALAPLVDQLGGVPALFGVSGYSGAGTTPSPKNDVARLKDNLMPYSLVGHKHEREVAHRFGHSGAVHAPCPSSLSRLNRYSACSLERGDGRRRNCKAL